MNRAIIPPIKPRSDLPPQPALIQWGTIGFEAFEVPQGYENQVVPRIGTGSSVSRGGREGVEPLYYDDLSGGFSSLSRVHDWEKEKNKVYFNEGITGTWIPGVATLPYKLTSQATLNAVDHSGFRAANKRVHAAMYQRRWYAIIGPQLYKNTSTSNPALTVPATADGLSDVCTAIAVGDIAGAQVLAMAGGTTDDIQYTADPTADTVSWTKMVTLSDTPYVNMLAYLKDVGPGIWVMAGRPSTALGKGVYHWKATATLPATPQPVILKETVGVLGTLATQTGAAVDLALSGVDGTSGTAANRWTASGGSATSVGTMADGASSGVVWFSGGDFSAYAKGQKVTGIQVTAAHTEDNGGADIFPMYVIIKAGGSTSESIGDGVELGTSGTDSYGSTTDTGGLDITTDDLAGLMVGFRYFAETPSVAGSVTISDVDVTITSQPYGTMPGGGTGGSGGGMGLGGFSCGPLPNDPSLVYVVEPEADDLTAVTVRRILVGYRFDWDTASDTATVELTHPATNLNYIGLIHPFQGGLAVAGGPNETLWNQVKLLDSRGQVRSLGFPGVHGTNALTITRLNSQGNYLIVDTAYTNGSEAQSWVYFDGDWFALGVQQDKSSAISTEPLLWAEATLDLQQNQLYRFYPVSTTHIAAAREFVPADLNLDPNVANTAEVKENGPLYVQGVRLNFGPEEANKAIVNLQCHSTRIDNNTAYGSLRVLVDTGGDATIAAAEIDQTFDAAAETFTDRNLASSLDPGIAYRTVIIRLIGDHEAGSAETPNLLPVEFNAVMQWPKAKKFRFLLSKSQPGGILNTYNRFMTLEDDTKVVQRLYGAGHDEPAMFLPTSGITYHPSLGSGQPTDADVKSAWLDFRITPGATS